MKPGLSAVCARNAHPRCAGVSCGCLCHAAPARVRLTAPKPTPAGHASRERVYDALVARHRHDGCAATVVELASDTALSVGVVGYHLSRLDALGRVLALSGRPRTFAPAAVEVAG